MLLCSVPLFLSTASTQAPVSHTHLVSQYLTRFACGPVHQAKKRQHPCTSKCSTFEARKHKQAPTGKSTEHNALGQHPLRSPHCPCPFFTSSHIPDASGSFEGIKSHPMLRSPCAHALVCFSFYQSALLQTSNAVHFLF